MQKLPKAVVVELEEIHSKLEQHAGVLNQMTNEFNKRVANVAAAINELQLKAFNLVKAAAEEAEAYFDERPEKWQEGEAGDAYMEWVEHLEETADMLEDNIKVELKFDTEDLDHVVRLVDDVREGPAE